MRALKSLSLLSILIFLPLLFYIFSLSLQAAQGSQTSVISNSTFTAPTGPTANAIIISNTLLDEGQPITAQVSGGTSPYTYNFIISQYGAPSNIIAFSGSVSNFLTSNSFVWTTNAIGTFVANVIVTDNAITPETINSVYSANIVVNPAPTAIFLTPSNTILDSGRYVTYNVLLSGGTLPITANLILVSNSIPIQINGANALPGTTYNTIVTGSDGVITFNSLLITTSSSGGYVSFNVVAVDSANTPVTFNAVANTITVNPILSVSISPTSNTLNAGQVLPLATTVTGGTPPFSITYSLLNDLCGSLSAPPNTLSADGTYTIVFTANSALYSNCSTTLRASVEDSASAAVTANATLTIDANVLTSTTSTTSTNTSTSTSSTSTIIAKVIPNSIYNLELDSNLPSQISFNGINYLVPNSIPVSTGNYQINALPVGNFIFSNWQVSNSNASITNTTAANTIVAISGNAIITANFNALTTFYEEGLPSNTAWNVTFNGNTSNAIAPNSITFITSPGQYSFQVANQVVGSNTFVPYPANGLVYAGNSITINFSIFTTSTTSTTSTSTSISTTTTITSTTTITKSIGWQSLVSINNANNSRLQYLIKQFNGLLANVPSVHRKFGNNIIEAINFSNANVPQNSIPSTLSTYFSGAKNIYAANVLILYENHTKGIFSSPININLFSNFSNNKIVSYADHAPVGVKVPILYSPNAPLEEISVITNLNATSILTNVTFLNNIPGNYAKFNNSFYQLIQINSTVSDTNIVSAVYNFSVSKAWIIEQHISPSQVTLYKYINSNSSWIPLPTSIVGENSTTYFYSAVSNSLSTYLVSYSTGGVYGDANPESVTLPSGYKLYICAAGANYTFATSSPAFSWTANILAPPGATALGSANASVGIQTSNICSAYTTGAQYPGLAVAGIGLNQTRYTLFTSASGSSSSASLSYTVATSNSFVVLAGAAGYYNFTTITLPSGCSMQVRKDNIDTFETAFIATCQNAASGSYTLSASLSYLGSAALAAYVFPPYNVVLNDNPTTATITTNGNTYASGSVMRVIGTNAITANKPTTGNWIFNSWIVSNSLNLSIANTLAPSTSLTVMGNGIVTATWNGITKFYETGLPSGAKWNVTYDSILNSSTTNTIVFSTLPGTYSFTIPVQKINGVAYEPSTASGSLYSGNAIAITFKPFSVSISPPSNAVVDAGQYETFTATVYNGISPYTYNILVVNSIAPAVIAHNDLVSGSSAISISYTFQTTSADVSNSPEEANVVVTDSFPATVNSVYSSTFTINPAMTTPSISPTSPATYSPGSTVTFSTSFTGGTPPYTYNWLVVNSITGALLANALYTGVSATSNSFAWTIPSADNGNTVVANVIVTDSASTPVTVNSTKSAVITISSATCTISLGSTAINFGSLNPGANIATTNAITDSNTGTANAYMYVYGGNWIYSSNTAISFYVANTVWSSTANTAYSSATRLSTLATNTTIFVPASGSNTIYFGLAVPGGAPVGAYTQNIIIANQC